MAEGSQGKAMKLTTMMAKQRERIAAGKQARERPLNPKPQVCDKCCSKFEAGTTLATVEKEVGVGGTHLR
jgi:hypothetical protein